jgi:hypothetical protein
LPDGEETTAMGAYQVFVWLLAWGFVGASIVVASTSGDPTTVTDSLIQFVGLFYLDTVSTLREFTELTAIAPRWTDAGYAVVSVVPLGVHVFLATAAAAYPDEEPLGAGDAVFGLGTIVGFCAVLAGLVFGLGAQLLAGSIIAVGIGVAMFGIEVAFGS